MWIILQINILMMIPMDTRPIYWIPTKITESFVKITSQLCTIMYIQMEGPERINHYKTKLKKVIYLDSLNSQLSKCVFKPFR
ncbi:hypothetical protein Hanom_Chr00s029703g01769161 [Helianthus anomalus]